MDCTGPAQPGSERLQGSGMLSGPRQQRVPATLSPKAGWVWQALPPKAGWTSDTGFSRSGGSVLT